MATATLSIDWEDFGQLYGKYRYGKFTEPVNNAIERQTNIILDLLDETGNKGTFFILGGLAGYRPALVKLIASRGHEIALHGQDHVLMYTLSPSEARQDIETALKIVTDIIGDKVYGYRAPFFSVKKENIYLLEILAELGFLYDSSIFPTALPRYGIAGFSKENKLYELPGGKEIVELPMTTVGFLNREWPVSGGGYMRLLPGAMVNRIFRKIAGQNTDSMIYMHPYEFDTQKINITDNYPAGATYSKIRTAATNFRWNIFRSSVTGKMRELLNTHDFTTCVEKATFIKQNTDAVPLKTG